MVVNDKDGGKSIVFKVNGIEIETEELELAAGQILELAKAAGAMPGNPDQYILQGDKGRYEPSDTIDLREDNIFITLPNTSTEVA